MAATDKTTRYYLSGMDWIMAALNNLNSEKTGIGNHFQLVLVLNGYLEKKVVLKKLSTALAGSCFLKGKTKRAWHLAPYWSPEISSFNPDSMQYFNLKEQKESTLYNILQKCAVRPFPNNRTLLSFDLIHCRNLTYLIMRFDHRMFDARGAEALLDSILANKKENSEEITSLQLPANGAQLHSWKSKFLSGQKINRFLRSIYSKETKTASLANESQLKNQNRTKGEHLFYLTSFSKDDTLKIDNNSLKKAGYLMNGIFLLSTVVKSFSLILKTGEKTGEILIPINVDVRETSFPKEKIFFNHVSFMLFKLGQSLSLQKTIESLKKQFIFQVKEKIIHHFINASLLMRIMPLNLLSKFMGYRMKKNQISFSFSYISEQSFHLKEVEKHTVLNLFHMPIVPYNPGIGFFFTKFNKKLNMVISGFDSKFDAKDVETLKMNILNEILNP